MHTNKFIIAVFFSLLLSCFSIAQNTFQKSLGIANLTEDNAEAIVETSDLGYLIVGNTAGPGAGSHDIFLVKLNQAGDTVWTRSYGTNGVDIGRDVCEAPDGSIYIIGETSNIQGAGLNDMILIKCSATGAMLWNKTYGGAQEDFGVSVVATATSGCVFTGQTFTNIDNQGDVLVTCVAGDGTVVWSYTYTETSYDDKIWSISGCNDGGFIMAGEAGSSWQGSYVVRLDAAGDTLWTGSYGGNGYYYAHDIKETSDNGFIMTGYATGGAAGGIDMFLMKLNANGDIQWAKTFGSTGYDDGQAVVETATGYALFGISTNFGAGSYDYYLVNTDANGNFVSAKTYGTSSVDEGKDLIATADGGFVMVGQFYNVIDYYQAYDMFIIKSDENGIVNGCYLDAPLTVSATDIGVRGTLDFTISAGQTASTMNITESSTTPNNIELAIQVYFETTPPSCGSSCDGEIIGDGCDEWQICGGTTPYTYNWSNGITTPANSNICAGNYSLSITDMNGCIGIGDTSISIVADPINMCLSSVDSTSQKNVIMWEKPLINGIDSFRIYREIVNNYTHIGSVDYDDISEFIDNTNGVNPNITYYRYKVSVLDSCGNESELSAYHETINAYTSVGAGGDITVNWNDYVGFGNTIFYRVMRDSTGTGDYFRKIDSTGYGITTYTDVDPSVGVSAYMIEVIAPAPCTSTKAVSRNSSRSNRPTVNGSGSGVFDAMLASSVDLYPNPNNGNFKLNMRRLSGQPVKIYIVNVKGQEIYQESHGNNPGWLSLDLNIAHVDKGFYFLHIQDGDRFLVKKLLLN